MLTTCLNTDYKGMYIEEEKKEDEAYGESIQERCGEIRGGEINSLIHYSDMYQYIECLLTVQKFNKLIIPCLAPNAERGR